MKASSWTAVALATATLLAGCGDDSESSDNAGASASGGAASGEPIRIGASLPLTGEISEPGKAAQRGYQVWEKMVNDQGGLLGRPVEMVIRDDASNQNTVTADYNALISRDDVDLLLGTVSSLLNFPASAVAERNRMLFVEPAGGAPDMFERGFKYLFFAQQATSDQQGDVWADWVLGLPASERPKTAAYPILDDPFAQATAEGIRAKLEAGGIETVYHETYPLDTKNFDAIASGVKASDPDVVVNGAAFADGVGMIRAFLKAGFTPDKLYQTNAPSLGNQFADAVGVGNTDGVMYSVSHSKEANTPGNAEFVAAYQEMFGGTEVPEDAADAYASAQVLQAAVEAAGDVSRDNQLELADWLRANEVPTVLGTLKWADDGRPEGQFLTGQWQDGAPEIVLPEDAATSDTILPGWEPKG